MSNLFTESECQHIASRASGIPISPPAQKPASVPGGSGAGLVGNPPKVEFCGITSKGWYCGSLSLRQFSKASSGIFQGLDPLLYCRVIGSLV